MTQKSPLEEAQVQSLDALFSEDPLKLSDTDIKTIVQELRRARAKWLAEGGKGPAKKVTKVAAKPGLTLEDLGL